MQEGTTLVFNVSAAGLLVSSFFVVIALFGIVWKGRKEIMEILEKEMAPIKSTVNRLVVGVTEVQTALKAKKGFAFTTLLERGASPLRPTKTGASLIKDSGLEKILDDNKDNLCTKLKASLPKDYTEYDVQENARKLLIGLKDDTMMNPVKEYVYNNPMEIEVILNVGGLWLRDDFLKQSRQMAPNDEGD